MNINQMNDTFKACISDHKKILKISHILDNAISDPDLEDHAARYLDDIREVIRWIPT